VAGVESKSAEPSGIEESKKNPPEPERAIDVMLAEFDAMRAEKVSHITSQAAIVGLGMTALGVIAGFVAKEGNEKLLLAVPPLVMLVVLGYAGGSNRSHAIGNYIRTELWPPLEDRVGKLPSWQREIAKARLKPSVIARAIFFDLPPSALFLAASVYALHSLPEREFLWWAGAGMTAISAIVPLAAAVAIVVRSYKAVKQT
jgi:cation transporter-like permease